MPKCLPMLNERQDAFVERADRMLRKSIPDRNSRMSAIAQSWSESGNEAKLQQRAKEALANLAECGIDEIDQHFVTKHNRPIFAEHETIGADGKKHRYDRAALAAIADRCNRRILDTGDLSALSAGHTPDHEQMAKGMPMPDLVGFAGPFRLALLGQEAPRWCIVADEHVFRDDYQRVKKMPRRSPEVWLEPRMEDRILDPIAVLGAETPRLDTGIGRFSRSARRLDPARYTNVQRYSAAAAAMPSGSNTFVMNDKYSAGDSPMDEAAIQQIAQEVLQGLMASAPMQWVLQQMGGDGQNPVPPAADQGPTPSEPDPAGDSPTPGTPAFATMDQMACNSPMPGATEPDGDEATPPATPAPSPATPSPSPEQPAQGGDDTGATPDELAKMGDDEKDEYSRLSPTHQYGYMKAFRRHFKPSTPGSMQYSNPVEKARYSRLEAENSMLKGEITALRSERTKAARYSKLSELSQAYAFDASIELSDCKDMTDAAFDRHCEVTIAKYARRDPMGGMPSLYTPPLDVPRAEDEAKRERYSKRAVEIATAAVKAGKTMTYEEAAAQAKAEIDK